MIELAYLNNNYGIKIGAPYSKPFELKKQKIKNYLN